MSFEIRPGTTHQLQHCSLRKRAHQPPSLFPPGKRIHRPQMTVRIRGRAHQTPAQVTTFSPQALSSLQWQQIQRQAAHSPFPHNRPERCFLCSSSHHVPGAWFGSTFQRLHNTTIDYTATVKLLRKFSTYLEKAFFSLSNSRECRGLSKSSMKCDSYNGLQMRLQLSAVEPQTLKQFMKWETVPLWFFIQKVIYVNAQQVSHGPVTKRLKTACLDSKACG